MRSFMFLALVAAAAPAAAVVTPVEGRVALGTEVRIGFDDSGAGGAGVFGDQPVQGWTTLDAPQTHVVISSAELALDDSFAEAFGQLTATWDSASSGSMSWSWGWLGTGPANKLMRTNIQRPDWSYSFTLDAPAVFTVRYDVAARGDVFGLQPINLEDVMSGAPLQLLGGSIFDPNGSGVARIALGAGPQTINMFNYGNIQTSGERRASATATINWSLSTAAPPVPEPATWAMLIAGFGMVGAALRRRAARVAG